MSRATTAFRSGIRSSIATNSIFQWWRSFELLNRRHNTGCSGFGLVHHVGILVLAAFSLGGVTHAEAPIINSSDSDYVFAGKWGANGAGDGQLNRPWGIAFDALGNVLVAEFAGARIQSFDADGGFVAKFGSNGSGDGEFSSPGNLVVDTSGNIYVADGGNDRVQKFDSSYTYVSQWGVSGTADGELSGPEGIAYDPAGFIYVGDRGNDRIQKFTTEGVFVLKWGSSGAADGEFNTPNGLALDSDGNVYVVDEANSRVQVFDSDGNFIRKWGSSGTGDGQFDTPKGITVGTDDLVYVADWRNERVQVFSKLGVYQRQWGSSGSADGQFTSTFGVARSAAGRVYVGDFFAHRIQYFDRGPAGVSTAVTMDEDGSPTPFDLTLGATDGDGDTITWSISSAATHGTASVSGTGSSKAITYVPNADYSGVDSFDVQVVDTNSELDTITVNVTIDPIGDVPVITQTGPLAVTMDEDGAPTAFVAPALDATHGDGTTLTWSVHTQAGHGTATVSGVGASPSTFTYAPDTEYHGSDSFTVQVSDGTHSDTIAINVTINVVDDAPVFISEYEFESVIATNGTADGQVEGACGILMNDDGNLVVAEFTGNRIQILTPSGTHVTKWGTNGTADGEMGAPCGLAFDASGNIYVAEYSGHRIQVFTPDGTYLRKWGTQGAGDGALNAPWGVAIGASGDVYVTDSFNYRVQVFDTNGNFLRKWGINGSGDGQFGLPYGVALDDSENVYVADNGGNRIQVFDSAGNFLRKWGSSGSGDGQFSSPTGITIADGELFVAEQSGGRVQLFDLNGDFKTKFGTSGSGEGQLTFAIQALPTASRGLYVTEFTGNRIQYFQGGFDGTTADVAMSEDGSPTPFALTLKAADAEGDTINWSISSAASNGDAEVSGTGASKAIAYTPDPDFDGTDSFDVEIADGNGGTDTITVIVTLDPEQDAPIIVQGAGPLPATMDEDGTFTPPTLSATDLDTGDTLTWSVSSQAGHGTATVSGTGAAPAVFTYVPDTNYHGSDSFTVQVSDGLDSDTINVSVTINAANDAPEFISAIEFGGKWGEVGSGDGQFNGVLHIATDSSGNVCVVDNGNDRVAIFDEDGIFLRNIGSGGTGDGQFSGPIGVDVDGDGNIYVADNSLNRIQKFDSSGNFLFKFGTVGTDPDQFQGVTDVAVGSSGNIFTIDSSYHRVQKFDSSGGHLLTWGDFGSGDGQFSSPGSLALDDAENVYVTDRLNHRVQVFDSGGNFQRSWGSNGTGAGQLNGPYGIDVGPDGNVYVVDSNNRRIQVFTTSGVFLETWGSEGTDDGQFSYPFGIAVAPSGRVFVSDLFTVSMHYFDRPDADGPMAVVMDEDGIPTTFALTLNASDEELDTITWSIASAASHGTATASGTGTEKAIAYTPLADYHGLDSFDVQIDDGQGGTNTRTVDVTINAQQDTPVITPNPSFVTMDEDGAPTAWVAPTVSATDGDGGTLTWTLEYAPQFGTATVSGTGSAPTVLDYVPNADIAGSDGFGVRVTDGDGNFAVANVSVTLNPVNDAPVIDQGDGPLTVTMDEEGTPTAWLAPTLSATDVDGVNSSPGSDDQEGDPTPQDPIGDILSWSVLTQASNGTATVSGDGASPLTFDYVPNGNFFGSDSFVAQVSDGNGGTDTIQIDVTVNNTHDVPVIDQSDPLSVTMDEDGAPTAWSAPTLMAQNPDSVALSWSVLTPASNGVATVSGGVLSPSVFHYAPNANFSGSDSFVVQVSDGNDGTDEITVNVTVNPVNDAPAITQTGPLAVTMDEDGTPLAFVAPAVDATDAEGDTITWSLAVASTNGTAEVSGDGAGPSTLTYVPDADFGGSDSFTLEASDGEASSLIEVQVEVTARNDSPVLALNSGTSVDEGGVVTLDAGMLETTDVDDAAAELTYTITTAPVNGLLSLVSAPETAVTTFTQADLNAARLTYTHNGGETTTDTFAFSVADGGEDDALPVIGEFAITVNPVNDAPELAAIGSSSGEEGVALGFVAEATDTENGVLTFSAAVLPEGATLDTATGAFAWVPTFEQAGVYEVTVTVTDDGDPAQSDSETIGITVANVNRAPELAAIGGRSGAEGELLSFTASATDVDGDATTQSATGLPEGASFDAETGVFAWTPGFEQSGSFDVTVTAMDNGDPALSDSEVVTITITNTNRAPELAAIGGQSGAEGSELAFAVTASDADGDTLTYTVEGLPEGANFDPETQAFVWTTGFTDGGLYEVTFTVTDDGNPVQSDSETVNVMVNEVNRAPVLFALIDLEVTEGELLAFIVSGTDPDGDNLTYIADDLPTGASLDEVTGILSWIPAVGDAGTYEVQLEVIDDANSPLNDIQSITITVLPAGGGEGEGEGDEGEGEGEGDLAEELRGVFAQADTNGDGLISRAESLLLFPDLTESQFDELDTNGDGFLSRAELDLDTPGGCFGPGSGVELFLVGLLLYFFNFCERIVRFPLRWWEQYCGILSADEDNGDDED